MDYRAAVASSDGKVVNQHFGHCRQFLIFETDDSGAWVFVGKRETLPACSLGEHSDSSMQQVVTLLSDCSAVAVSQIGYGAVQALNSEGIHAFIISDFINQALEYVRNGLERKC